MGSKAAKGRTGQRQLQRFSLPQLRCVEAWTGDKSPISRERLANCTVFRELRSLSPIRSKSGVLQGYDLGLVPASNNSQKAGTRTQLNSGQGAGIQHGICPNKRTKCSVLDR
jgi:hypothetical protein